MLLKKYNLKLDNLNGMKFDIIKDEYKKGKFRGLIHCFTASEKLAQDIRNKTEGFEFLANIITSDILRLKPEDLAVKDK